MSDHLDDLPIILSVEDEYRLQECYQLMLKGRVRVLSAYTVKQGREMFRAYPKIKLIVMDGHVPAHEGATTIDLVREIRASGFTGTIIASSSNVHFQGALIREGCDDTCTIKCEVPEIVLRVLGLSVD